ncbi:hypothetical protein HWV62_7874 [Athelia sp. TMB]|nr:hypothetical protein HWV62_7874 [Athelia sp. TMB]
MASAADVRSILSLPSSSAGPSQTKKPAGASTRKPEGISRELFALIGTSAPSIAAQLAKPRLKQKPNLGGGGKVKWEWRNFKNGARNDGLELGHWAKASVDPAAEYPFVKYDVHSTVYTYSQDEYTRFLEDKEWSKEETDYLFSVVQEYDSRWYVIHDRYEYTGGVPRALEDLKDRYYSVCRKLVRNRPWAGDESSKAALISSFQFDKERETTRKKYVASLESRTPEQIAEEEALYIELKRLEQNERRFKREREELLRTLAGIESGLPEIIAVVDEEGPITSAMMHESASKRKRRGTLDTPSTPSNVISLAPPIPKRAQSAKSAAYDAQNCIVRVDPTPTSISTTKITHQPVHLRSFKLPIPKANIHPKVTQILTELGVSHTRLVMPTRENSVLLESLMDAASALVETKKVADKVEQDIRVLMGRLGRRVSEPAETDPDADGDADADGETNTGTGTAAAPTPMNIDDGGDGEGENGRAQSVLSTRSARSRKQSRRSMSVSSIDTSASASTRGGRKRQKRA